MTKKNWMLVGLALVLGSISLYMNRDWFAGDDIQIISRSMPRRGFFNRKRTPAPATMPVVFGLSRKLALTDIKVVAVGDAETNKYPHPLWHILSDSNSVPTREFFYGVPLRGMRPEFKGTAPEPLEPGKKYRLFIQAGSQKAQHDFEARPAPQQ